MSWERLEDPEPEQRRELDRLFGRKARFLVDESLGEGMVGVLRALGWKAVGVEERGLAGHSDEDVYALAWREQLMILTKDRDFLDDRRFPPNRNPGVIVLPDGPVDAEGFVTALRSALGNIAPLSGAYKHSKITVDNNGEITIISRERTTGKMTRERFKVERGGALYRWVDT